MEYMKKQKKNAHGYVRWCETQAKGLKEQREKYQQHFDL